MPLASFGTGEKVAFGAHNCTLQFLRARSKPKGEGGRWLLVVVSVSLMCVGFVTRVWGRSLGIRITNMVLEQNCMEIHLSVDDKLAELSANLFRRFKLAHCFLRLSVGNKSAFMPDFEEPH